MGIKPAREVQALDQTELETLQSEGRRPKHLEKPLGRTFLHSSDFLESSSQVCFPPHFTPSAQIPAQHVAETQMDFLAAGWVPAILRTPLSVNEDAGAQRQLSTRVGLPLLASSPGSGCSACVSGGGIAGI